MDIESFLDLLHGILFLLLGLTMLLLPFIIAISYHTYRTFIPFSIPVKYHRLIKIAAFVMPPCFFYFTAAPLTRSKTAIWIGWSICAFCVAVLVKQVYTLFNPAKHHRIIKIAVFVLPLCWFYFTADPFITSEASMFIQWVLCAFCMAVLVKQVYTLSKWEMGYAFVLLFYYFLYIGSLGSLLDA